MTWNDNGLVRDPGHVCLRRVNHSVDAAADGDCEVFPPVLLRGDFSANGMKPFVAVCVIEVPMCMDQVFDRIVAQAIERLGDSWA